MCKFRNCFIFLYVERVEIEKNIDTPVGIKVVRKKKVNNFSKTTFKAVSQLQMSDGNNSVHFDCEFCIKSKLVMKKGHSKYSKKNVIISFYTVSMQEKKTLISWKIDAANTEENNEFKMFMLNGKNNEFGEIKLFYRINIENCDKFNEQTKFINSRTIGDVLVNFDDEVITEVVELVSESQNPTQVQIKSKNQSSRLNNFIKPVENNRKNVKNDVNDDNKNKGKMEEFLKHNENKNENAQCINETEQKDDQNIELQQLILSHKKNLLKLSLSQCSVCFNIIIVNNLISPTKISKDFSGHLIEPILSFSILTLPEISAEDIDFLFEPLYKALDFTLSLSHTFEELFSILASVLNFGLKLSSSAPIFSSLHLPVLEKLSDYITQSIMQLTQILISVITPSISNDGFEFADVETLNLMQQETRQFLQLCHSFNVPELVVQIIVIETCKYIDTLVFNVIIDTASIISPKKINDLLQKTRKIETIFNCLPCNFQIAFNNLLSFISNANLLWSKGFDFHFEKSDLMRAIVERCQPSIILPNDMKLDDIGNHLEKNDSLKLPLPKFGFKFSYEWLYTHNINSWLGYSE